MGLQYSVRRAFTLIELLVVVAIIALLLGILIPALGKARLSAQTVKSKANLRSIGQIQFLYAGDFADSYINPFNTTRSTGGGPGAAGWATVRKEGLGGFYHFTGPGEWYSEMYAFHWYSLVGGWISQGDYASEVQFAPADKIIISRFEDLLIDNENFNLNTGIWDCSYVLSPTLWYSSRRYANDNRPENNRNSGPNSLARRNKVSETSFPSSKVITWERFDWSKRTRSPSIPNPIDPTAPAIAFPDEVAHPQWNNSNAEPNVLTADGSVVIAKINDIRAYIGSETQRDSDALRPTDMWNPPSSLIQNYGMDQDGFEIGSNLEGFGPGQYPAYFWATRDGIKGRDIVR